MKSVFTSGLAKKPANSIIKTTLKYIRKWIPKERVAELFSKRVIKKILDVDRMLTVCREIARGTLDTSCFEYRVAVKNIEKKKFYAAGAARSWRITRTPRWNMGPNFPGLKISSVLETPVRRIKGA